MALGRSEGRGRKNAVIIDIDDTIIDTSRYQAYLTKKKQFFPFEWSSWCCGGTAMAVPGSREFLEYASGRGYSIFYISNRNIDLLDCTIADMQRLGFPQCTREHVLLKSSGNSKKNRRGRVLEGYRVKLMIGDNIEDFSDLFESKSNTQRKELVDAMEGEFGSRFIILPNAMYGSWLYQVMGRSGMAGITDLGGRITDALDED